MNINTEKFWNDIHTRELTDSWRMYPATFDLVAKHVGSKKVVVELGCGMGILAKKLIEQKNTYLGIDISGVPEKVIKEMGGSFASADIMNMWAIGKGFSDCVVATEFLEHFEDVDYVVHLSKAFLKPNGVAIFSVPNNCLGHDVLEEHYQQFTSTSLSKLFLKYYKNVEVYEFTEFFVGRVTDLKTKEMIKLPTLLVVASDEEIKEVEVVE